MTKKQLIAPSEFDKKGKTMKVPNVYDKKNRAIGAKTSVRPETVVVKGPDGTVYGRRTIMQKTCEDKEMPMLSSLLDVINEGKVDDTSLPDRVMGELKKLVRQGASDLEQKWANALELVHKAYQVGNVRRPSPDQTGAWKQYEEIIQFAVRELYKARGIEGDWRMTSSASRD